MSYGERTPARTPARQFFMQYRWMMVSAAAFVAILAVVVAFNLGGGSATPEQTIRVHAASSLRDVFTDFKTDFELANPEATIELNFGGSNAIVTQLTEGAPGDVVATADQRTMQRAMDAGLIDGDATVVARNRLEVAVPSDNPAGIESLEDLAGDEIVVALCAEQVPCGTATVSLLDRADLTIDANTLEPSVRSVLAKVVAGEVDAGIVFRTDVVSAADAVIGLPISDDVNVTTDTLVARLVGAVPLTSRFLRFTTSLQAAVFFTSAGFDLP